MAAKLLKLQLTNAEYRASRALPAPLQFSAVHKLTNNVMYQDGGRAPPAPGPPGYGILRFHDGDAPYELCFEERFFLMSMNQTDFCAGRSGRAGFWTVA